MKNKKILAACLLVGTMALALVGCKGDGTKKTDADVKNEIVQEVTSTPEPETEPVQETVTASLDFEDGNMGFVYPVC